MKNLDITDKEIIWHSDLYAIIVFDDMNYDILEKKVSEETKDVPEKGIKKGDTKITWRSLPSYHSELSGVIKSLLNIMVRDGLRDTITLSNALDILETTYAKIKSEMNFSNTIEYRKMKSEMLELQSKFAKKNSKSED